MAILDLTALASVLETQYTQTKVYNLCYEESKTFSKFKKKSNFVGGPKHVAFRYGSPQARGANFGVAIGNMSASSYAGVDVKRVSEYCFVQLLGESIAAAKGQPGALLDAVKAEFDGGFYTAARSLAIALFQAGGGARGVVGAISGSTFTLSDINQVVNYERNMVLNMGSTDGTSGTKFAGTVTVSGVNRDTGVITCTAGIVASISSAVVGSFVFQNGDFEAAKSMVSGIPAWIPKVAPTPGDNFWGLDRSVDPTRLAGLRITKFAGGPIEETLIQAAAQLRREGGKPDMAVMNPLDIANLVVALGSKVIYDRSKSVDGPEIGFMVVKLMTPSGVIEIIDDINVGTGDCWLLTSSVWSFETAGGGPRILDDDGNKMLRDATTDSYIARIGYYGNVICEAPGFNAYVKL